MIKLRPWQEKHAENLLAVLSRKGVALDLSDTGTGKTFIASWIARNYKHPVFVVCPKAVQPKWHAVLKEAGIKPVEVMNVEKLKRSKYLLHRGKLWTWMLAPGTLVIFDEAHNFGGTDTGNAMLLFATRAAKLPVLALSATIAYSPLRFRAMGYLLGLFPDWYGFWNWSLAHGAQKIPVYRADRGKIWTIQFNPHSGVGKQGIQKIHDAVIGAGLAFRIKSDETPGFPENNVYVDKLTFDAHPEILKVYQKEKKLLDDTNMSELTKLIELRQKAERLKAPDLARMAVDMIEEHGVVIFVNFLGTVDLLASSLCHLKPAVIVGDQNADERETERLRFVNNETPVCICTFGAGGVGLDLQDLHGKPRISLINPTWSAVQFKQSLGRIHREDAKSPATQRLLFAAGTVEEDVAHRVEANLNNLSLLQDGDLEFK